MDFHLSSRSLNTVPLGWFKRKTNGEQISLQRPFNGVKSFFVQKLGFPAQYETVMDRFNNTIYWTSYEGTHFTATIAIGNYTQTTLAAQIALVMSTTDTLHGYTWIYNSTYDNYGISSDTAVGSWKLETSKFPFLADQLGLITNDITITGLTTYQSTKKTHMQVYSGEIYVHITEINNEDNVQTNMNDDDNVICGFVINKTFGTDPYFIYVPEKSQVMIFDLAFNLNKITITFKMNIDGKLYPLYFNGGDWYLNLNITTKLDRKRKQLEFLKD